MQPETPLVENPGQVSARNTILLSSQHHTRLWDPLLAAEGRNTATHLHVSRLDIFLRQTCPKRPRRIQSTSCKDLRDNRKPSLKQRKRIRVTTHAHPIQTDAFNSDLFDIE